jgi:ribosome modulation factor
MGIDYSRISEKAWVPKEMVEGSQAYVEGKAKDDNPYLIPTIEAERWLVGWINAECYDEYLGENNEWFV